MAGYIRQLGALAALITWLWIPQLAWAQIDNVPPTALASPTAQRAQYWQTFTARDATRGLWEVHSAYNGRPKELVLSFSPYYSRTADLLIDGDINVLQRQTFALSYTWRSQWLLGASFEQTLNSNSAYDYEPTRSLGDPTLTLQYATRALPHLAMAGRLRLGVPTAAQTTGLAFRSMSAHLGVLSTWEAFTNFEASVNIGYTLDARNNLFSGISGLNNAQRFAAGIPSNSRVEAGLGAAWWVRAKTLADVAPWAEITASMGPIADAAQWPVAVGAGLKVLPNNSRRWEISLGARRRINGNPRNNLYFSGLPPWGFFGQLAVHSAGENASLGQSCDKAADCPEGLACIGGRCSIKPPEPLYTIVGAVVNRDDGLPIGGSTVILDDAPGVRYISDSSGHFQSAQIAFTRGQVRVRATAPDFFANEVTVDVAMARSALPIRLALTPNITPAEGDIQGVVLNSRSGAAIPEVVVFLPVLSRRLVTDANGAFRARLPAGKQQVVFVKPGFVTQRKDVQVERDGNIIFNIDMHRTTR